MREFWHWERRAPSSAPVLQTDSDAEGDGSRICGDGEAWQRIRRSDAPVGLSERMTPQPPPHAHGTGIHCVQNCKTME